MYKIYDRIEYINIIESSNIRRYVLINFLLSSMAGESSKLWSVHVHFRRVRTNARKKQTKNYETTTDAIHNTKPLMFQLPGTLDFFKSFFTDILIR